MTALPSTASAASAPKILVVDDAEVMRDLLRRRLERSGFTVITAADGSQGMECVRRHTVSLVITDMLMPVMDGLELIRALVVEKPEINIIAFSGADEAGQHLRRAAELGAKAVIRTPVAGRALVSAVREVLAAS